MSESKSDALPLGDAPFYFVQRKTLLSEYIIFFSFIVYQIIEKPSATKLMSIKIIAFVKKGPPLGSSSFSSQKHLQYMFRGPPEGGGARNIYPPTRGSSPFWPRRGGFCSTCAAEKQSKSLACSCEPRRRPAAQPSAEQRPVQTSSCAAENRAVLLALAKQLSQPVQKPPRRGSAQEEQSRAAEAFVQAGLGPFGHLERGWATVASLWGAPRAGASASKSFARQA